MLTAVSAASGFRLDDRAAIVTGAARGIGASIAVALAEMGADVGCVDRDAAELEATVAAIETRGRRALALAADVSSFAPIEAAVDRVESEVGPLRLAVNSAGIHQTRPAEDMEPDAWRQVLDVDLTGVFNSCRAEGRAMLAHGMGGSIVNLGSISATIANRGLKQAHYNAAKAGVVHLTRSLALEWAGRGIRVNSLSPGYVRTTMARGAQTDRAPDDFIDDIPMRRMASADEMAGPAIFLLSDAASYCTGAELIADGGATAW